MSAASGCTGTTETHGRQEHPANLGGLSNNGSCIPVRSGEDMSAASYFRAQAYNNAWANHRLLTSCARLSRDELAAERVGFFPSIVHTLNHILTVDWYYVSALEGSCIGYSAFDPEIPFTDFEPLRHEQRAVDRRLIDFCEQLNDSSLRDNTEILRGDWIQNEPADRVLLHLFQHQIHHRGQVHTMLSGTDVKPPQLDEFFLGHEREQALRADDFAALGFDDARIWR